jgi:hypothetical protein
MIDYKKLAAELVKNPDFCRTIAEETERFKQEQRRKETEAHRKLVATLHKFDYTNNCKLCGVRLWMNADGSNLNAVCPKAPEAGAA